VRRLLLIASVGSGGLIMDIRGAHIELWYAADCLAKFGRFFLSRTAFKAGIRATAARIMIRAEMVGWFRMIYTR